jgi:preprotein translocase subunit SecA
MKKLLIPVSIFLLIIISSVIFIGGGYLISLVIPLTLFQASILCIGATFVLVFIITIVMVVMVTPEHREWSYGDEEDDYDDEEDDEDVEEDETDNTTKRKIVDMKTVKIGRNKPCPCGSGKKYKHCCGK